MKKRKYTKRKKIDDGFVTGALVSNDDAKEVIAHEKEKIKEANHPYKASIKIMGRTFNVTGESVKDCMSKLSVGNLKGRGIITMEHNGIKKEKILQPRMAVRLFNTHGLMHEIAVKNASLLFQGL